MPRLPHMLQDLSQRLDPFHSGCAEWRAAWAEWKGQVWYQEFPPPDKNPMHDPVNKRLANDLQLESIRPKPNQCRFPVPLATNITEQYLQAMWAAKSAVAADDVSSGFTDQEFPSGHEDLRTGYSSLFVDAETPCDDEWMNHPEAPSLQHMSVMHLYPPGMPYGLSPSLAMTG